MFFRNSPPSTLTLSFLSCVSVSVSLSPALPPIRSLLTLFWNRRQTVAFNLIKIK